MSRVSLVLVQFQPMSSMQCLRAADDERASSVFSERELKFMFAIYVISSPSVVCRL